MAKTHTTELVEDSSASSPSSHPLSPSTRLRGSPLLDGRSQTWCDYQQLVASPWMKGTMWLSLGPSQGPRDRHSWPESWSRESEAPWQERQDGTNGLDVAEGIRKDVVCSFVSRLCLLFLMTSVLLSTLFMTSPSLHVFIFREWAWAV